MKADEEHELTKAWRKRPQRQFWHAITQTMEAQNHSWTQTDRTLLARSSRRWQRLGARNPSLACRLNFMTLDSKGLRAGHERGETGCGMTAFITVLRPNAAVPDVGYAPKVGWTTDVLREQV